MQTLREQTRQMRLQRCYRGMVYRTLNIYQVQQLYYQYVTAAFNGNLYSRKWYARQASNLSMRIKIMQENRQFETTTNLEDLSVYIMHAW